MKKEDFEWGNADSVDNIQQQETPRRSLIDDIGDAISAIGENFNVVRGSGRIGDLMDSLANPSRGTTEEEYYQNLDKLENEYIQRELAQQRYKEAQDRLVADDSFLKNVTQMGGTIEGMAAQALGTVGGAAIGGIATGGAGLGTGAKVGNAVGAVAGGYLDARSVALEARERVLEQGGTWEQAQQAYDETLKKASLTTLPETLVDIAMGNRLVGSALNSRVARKVAGSTLGRVGASVLDPAAKVGTAVSRMTRPIVGRAAGLATDVALQGSTEAAQEVTQDYIADREVAKAMQQADNEYSLGGFGRYATSKQGLETMKTAGIMGALFGGVGGTLSSGQYLQRGSDTVMGNKAYNAVESMVQDGSIKLDKEKREAIEDYIHHVTGKSQAELSTWSDGDIISQYASSFAERFNPGSNEDMNYSVVRGVVEGVKDTVIGDEARGSRENDLTTTAEKVLERMGVDADTRQKLFVSSAEQSVIEKAKQAEQTETKTESGDSAIKTKLSPKLAEEVKNNDGKTVQEVHKEEVAAKQGTPVQSANTTDGVIGEVSYKDNIGEEWTRVPYTTQSGQELEGARYHNNKTEKNAIITKRNDGQFFVMDEDNTTGRVVPTLEKAEAILSKNKDERRMFQSDDAQATESPTVPEGGVNAETSGNTGVRISNIHDLSKFMDENPNSIDPEWLRQFISVTQRIAPENWEMYLDVNNYGYVYDKESGKWGKVRGWADTNKQNSMGRAIFQLYRGADIGTAIHEIAHHGYWNLSERDRKTFDNYAVKSAGKFIANILGETYDQTFIERLKNAKEGEDLYNKIISNSCYNQVKFLLNSLNLQSLDIQDKYNMTDEQVAIFRKQRQDAIEERWAWEFSNWYAEGYVKGYTGDNVIERILQRGCVSMASALNGIQKLWEHLHHRNSESETPVEDLYRGINSTRNEVEQQVEQQQYEQESEEEYSEPTYQETETSEDRGFDNSVFTTPEEQFDDTRTSPVNQDNVGRNPWNRRRANPLVTVNNSVTNQNEQGLSNLNNSVGEYTGGQRENREPSTMIGGRIMNDTTAEIVADEMLRRYGNDYDEMKKVWTSLYDNAENDEERRWFTKIAKIAGQKYQQSRKGVATTNRSKSNNPGQLNEGTKQINQNQRQSNIVPYENRTEEMTFGGNELQANTLPLDTMRFGSNELRATPINEQTLNEVNRLAEENRQNKSTETQEVESQEETEENGNVSRAEERSATINETIEKKEKVFKIKLEDPDVDDIKWNVREVLSEMVGVGDKTAKKIVTSVNKRVEASSAAMRRATKPLDKESAFFKNCYLSSLENILKADIKDGLYESGELDQNKVDQIGSLIEEQLGEEQDDEIKLIQEQTQSSGRRQKLDEERAERERKEKEKEEKKKQEEAYLKNLEKMEQYANETENQELTDEQLEEKAEKEISEQQQKETKIKENKQVKFKNKKERATYLREFAKKNGKSASEVLGKKTQIREISESDRVVNGWVERFLEKGDYNDAMYELQELLDRGTITEEEYNKIQKRLENALGDEDYSSGRQYQRANDEELSPKAQRNKQILEKAFPGRRFQIATHASRVNFSGNGKFDEFLLEHLGSGVGDQVHGHGLYVSIGRLTAKKYFNNFQEDYQDYQVFDYDVDSAALTKLGLSQEGIDGLKVAAYNEENPSNYDVVVETLDGIESSVDYIEKIVLPEELEIQKRGEISPLGISVDRIKNDLRIRKEDLKVLRYLKNHPEIIGLTRIRNNENENNRPTLYIVNVPDEKYCLEEEKPLRKQPKFARDRLIKLLKEQLGKDEYIYDAIDFLDNKTDYGDYSPYNGNIYKQLMDILREYQVISGDKKKRKKQTSELLNMYGIKGMYYNGVRDGRCAVIFDDKAMDIIDKFQKKEAEWNRVEIKKNPNVKERESELAQKKLEKHNIKNSRRFMLASEKRDNAKLADTNTPQFKKWFGKSTAVKADGSPRVFYRGQGHEYNPDYNFSKTDANRNKLTWVAQSKGFVERGQYNGENGQGDLWEVYIKAENPFYIGLIDSSSDQAEKNPKTLYEDLKKRMGREAKYGRITKKQLEEFLKKIDYLRQGKRSDGKVSTENGPVYYYLDKDTTLVNAIKDLGYDSIIGIEDNTNTYALFEPTQVKSIYNKGTFDENNRDIRYQMEETEKTPLEKAKQQRDARLEKQRKEGITSDVYKDVYSVIFEKDSTNNEENKHKMEYFDKRSEYWDRHEKGGRVTYTRKTPFEHHQQVIRYSGINGVEKTEKPKSKPAQWAEWLKDQIIKYAFNDLHFLAKAARKLGVYDTYTKMIVTKGYALKANTAMQNGIKYNGKNTRALNDIIREIGEEKQKDFIDYCIAKRILDMEELRPEIKQKMSPDEAREIIEGVENGKDAKLFMKNQKDFVEYNHALLHVLVDGGIMTEEEFQKFLKKDPNFVPLAKVMDDADFGFNCIQSARSIVNVKSPIKKIGTSMREVKNPFLEMQKRTAEYYAIASRNKAGQIFVNEIAGVLDKNAKGDTIAKGQSMIRKVKVDEKDGKLITKPNEQEQIIFVCNNGVNEFYQVSDPEIYRALRALDADQMGTLHKMIDPFLHAPSALIRETATMVPDFGIRNLIRDGGEAFLTSEHGFLPFIDQIWGMYQMANNTEWYQRFLEQQGEYGTYNRDSANDNIVRIEDTVDEKVNPWKNFQALRESYMNKFTNKKNSKATRALALLQLVGSMPYAIVKSNKRINDYLEMGTRVAEFKNAKMGYEGTLDRLSQGGIFDWGATLSNAKQSDIIAAGAAKEITLNFGQHGIIGKQLNRYIPFFNATLQGIYKLCNSLQLLFTGTTLSGEKNRKLQSELLFKAALTVAMGIGVAAAGEGDDDYEEANQYEKENFWILPNGLRFPKDQVLGKLFGNTAEKSYTQWRKGKFEPSDILKSIIENFTPDKFMPAMADIVLGGYFNYDTFYKSPIVPEYMQGKLGHLQKDLSTSNMATDVSDALWKYFHTDVSAKRLDWALQKNFTNVKKYVDAMYDLGKKTIAPETFNEKMARGYDKSDSTGEFVGGLKDDIPKPLSLITGTFATNRTNYKSISDFYEKYNELKRLSTDEASMTKEEKRKWKKYEDAYKKDKLFRKQLRAIKQDRSLTGKQKRERADKIFRQQIKLAKWAEG